MIKEIQEDKHAYLQYDPALESFTCRPNLTSSDEEAPDARFVQTIQMVQSSRKELGKKYAPSSALENPRELSVSKKATYARVKLAPVKNRRRSVKAGTSRD